MIIVSKLSQLLN